MNFKIVVHCNRCNNESTLTASNFAGGEEFKCQNCGQLLDSVVYQTLCNALTALQAIPSNTSDFELDKGFKIHAASLD